MLRMGKRFTEPKTTGVRLTIEDQEIVARLRDKIGVDFTSLVRMGIRRLAEDYGLRPGVRSHAAAD